MLKASVQCTDNWGWCALGGWSMSFWKCGVYTGKMCQIVTIFVKQGLP